MNEELKKNSTRSAVDLDTHGKNLSFVFVWHRITPFTDPFLTGLPIQQINAPSLEEACEQLIRMAGEEFQEGQVIAWIRVNQHLTPVVPQEFRKGWAKVRATFTPRWVLDITGVYEELNDI